MLYLIALVFPPLALLLCGKPFQALICLPLCCFYFPAALWAILVVANHNADRRALKVADIQVQAIKAQTAALHRLAKSHEKAVESQGALAPVPAPRPVPDDAFIPAASPKAPWKMPDLAGLWGSARDGLLMVRVEAVRAYRNLPDWAEPIVWGLSAGTVVSVPLVMFLVSK